MTKVIVALIISGILFFLSKRFLPIQYVSGLTQKSNQIFLTATVTVLLYFWGGQTIGYDVMTVFLILVSAGSLFYVYRLVKEAQAEPLEAVQAEVSDQARAEVASAGEQTEAQVEEQQPSVEVVAVAVAIPEPMPKPVEVPDLDEQGDVETVVRQFLERTADPEPDDEEAWLNQSWDRVIATLEAEEVPGRVEANPPQASTDHLLVSDLASLLEEELGIKAKSVAESPTLYQQREHNDQLANVENRPVVLQMDELESGQPVTAADQATEKKSDPILLSLDELKPNANK